MKHLGNGEGFTTLVLTDAESRLIRECLDNHDRALRAYNAGIQRGTDRIKAEFDTEQKARKEQKK